MADGIAAIGETPGGPAGRSRTAASMWMRHRPSRRWTGHRGASSGSVEWMARQAMAVDGRLLDGIVVDIATEREVSCYFQPISLQIGPMGRERIIDNAHCSMDVCAKARAAFGFFFKI